MRRPAHVSLYLLALTLAYGYFNLKLTPPEVPASEGADKNSARHQYCTVYFHEVPYTGQKFRKKKLFSVLFDISGVKPLTKVMITTNSSLALV